MKEASCGPCVQPRVAVIVLNWNGWADTIECLESLLRIDYSEYVAIVCDNGSSDGSTRKIRAWAEGTLRFPAARDNPLRPLTYMDVSAATMMGLDGVTNLLVLDPAQGVSDDDLKLAF